MEHLRNISLEIFEKSIDSLSRDDKDTARLAFYSALLSYVRSLDGHLRGKTVYGSNHKSYGFSCDCGEFKHFMKGGNDMIDDIRKETDEEIKYISKRFFDSD